MSEGVLALSFEGFSAPSYTSVPDDLFDRLMVDLSLAELRVVLYICRRTFGFKKQVDAISLSQMLDGIRKRDGTQLDRGVGLARSTLFTAIRSLVRRGIIVKMDGGAAADGGTLPSVYSLRFKNPKKESPAIGEGGVPEISTPGVPTIGTPGVPDFSTHNKQSPTNSSTTPPSNLPQELTEYFYRSLGSRVSPQKGERGRGEIQKILESGFSEKDIRYAIDYVVKTYPDTKTIGRLPFLLDEALKKRERERTRETVDVQINRREAERQVEASKRWEDQRAIFDALPEDRRKELLSRVPPWVEREASRVAWAIGQMQREKPDAGNVSSQRLIRGLTAVNPSLDRAVFHNSLERKMKIPHRIGLFPSSAPATTPPLPNYQE